MYGKHERGKDVVDDRLVFHLKKQPCQLIRADLVLKVALLGISPRISTGFVESTVNQVISKRMVKKQPMQWSPRGAHLLLQLRTRVLSEE